MKLTPAEIENEWSCMLCAFMAYRGTIYCVTFVYPAVGGLPDGAVLMSDSYNNMAAVRSPHLSCEWL